MEVSRRQFIEELVTDDGHEDTGESEDQEQLKSMVDRVFRKDGMKEE
jgi:hypothetical protein